VTEEEARIGGKFKEMETKLGPSMTGLRQSFATPFMATIGENEQQITESAASISNWLGVQIPASNRYLGESMKTLQPVFDYYKNLWANTLAQADYVGNALGKVLYGVDGTKSASSQYGEAGNAIAGMGGSGNTYNVSVNADPADSTRQLADRLQSKVQAAHVRQQQEREGFGQQANVYAALSSGVDF